MRVLTNEWVTQFLEFVPESRSVTLLFEYNRTQVGYAYKIANGFVLRESIIGSLGILQNDGMLIQFVNTSGMSNHVRSMVVNQNNEIVLAGSHYSRAYDNFDSEITTVDIEGNVISQWHYSRITQNTIIPYYVLSLIIELVSYGLFLHTYHLPKGWYKEAWKDKFITNEERERLSELWNMIYTKTAKKAGRSFLLSFEERKLLDHLSRNIKDLD